MSEIPKTDKKIQQEAFLGKMRQLGRDNLPDETIFVPVNDLLGATDLFDIQIRSDIKEGITKILAKYRAMAKTMAIRIEAMELASLDRSGLEAWLQEWVMTTGVLLLEAEERGALQQIEREHRQRN